MKKIIFILALCILNLFVIIPNQFNSARNNINEGYNLGIITKAELTQNINKINYIEKIIKFFTLLIIFIAIFLSIQKFNEISKNLDRFSTIKPTTVINTNSKKE